MILLLAALFLCATSAHDAGCDEAPAPGDDGLCAWDPSAPPRAPPATILALSGSLRRLSSNSALARAAAEASPSVQLAPLRLDELPFFDADVEAAGLPHPVAELREAAFAASGFFFATPEYNGVTSAALKNALDWLSRSGPEGASPLKGKPYAVVSAGGGSGGARAQASIDTIAGTSGMVRVGGGAPVAVKLFDGVARFDEETGDLVDAEVRAAVGALVEELEGAAQRFAAAAA